MTDDEAEVRGIFVAGRDDGRRYEAKCADFGGKRTDDEESTFALCIMTMTIHHDTIGSAFATRPPL